MENTTLTGLCDAVADPPPTLSRDLLADDARVASLQSLLSEAFSYVADATAAVEAGDSETGAPSEALNAAATEYITALSTLLFPVLGVAALVVLAWLPLWISRCCSHKCCAPPSATATSSGCAGCCCGPDPPSKARKGTSTCCCCLWWLGVLGAAAAAAAGCSSIELGVKQSMCAADELLGDVAGELDSAAAAADAFGAARDAATGALRSSKSSLQCVTAAFDGGGAISEACGNVTALHSALKDIDDRVASASGGAAAADDNADFAAALDAAADMETTLCVTLPDAVAGPAATALAGVESAEESIGGGANGLDFLDGFAELSATITDAHTTYSNNTAEVVWPNLTYVPLVALALVAVTILALLCICTGGFCMALSKVGRCGSWCGIQCTGCGWVTLTLATPFTLLFTGAIFLFFTALLTDVGAVLQPGLAEPNATLAPILGADACTTSPLAIESANGTTLSLCAVVAGCWSGNATVVESLLDQLTAGSSFSITADEIEAAIEASGATDALDSFDTRALEEAVAPLIDTTGDAGSGDAVGAGAVHAPCTLTPEDFGQDPNTDAGAYVAARLGAACAAATAANASVLSPRGAHPPLLTCVDALAAPLDVSGIATGVAAAVAPLLTSLDCSWMPEAYEGTLGPLLWGSSLDGLATLAAGLIAAGVLSLFLVGASIAMQVHWGQVYAQPGCPSCCRCCCPGYGEKAPRGKHPATLSGHYGGWADSPACSGTNQDMWSGGFGGGGKDGDWATGAAPTSV